MGYLRLLLCIFMPPAAVLDKGMVSIVLVTVLWLMGWVPGAIGALFICMVSAEVRKNRKATDQ